MIIRNYIYVLLADFSKKIGRGKYYRKKLFSTKRILEKNYKINSEFSFIQVGANDGISFDFLYEFLINRISVGILIEPVKEYFDELFLNYKKFNQILKVNKALHKSKKNAIIYKVDKTKFDLYPDWVKGIASFEIKNLTKFNIIKPQHIVEELVEADTLMNIVKESEFEEFDYIQVDTEGYDFKVIEMIDFSILKPKLIKAEFVNLSKEEKVKIRKLLYNQGYYVFFEGLDIIGVNLNKIKL